MHWMRREEEGALYDGRITGWIYSDDDEFYDFIGEIVPDALSRNMKVLFIIEPGRREEISSNLAEEGIFCNEMISGGRLLFPSGFSRSGENLPDAGEVIRLLDYESGEAEKNGYRSLLVIADCLCLLGNSPSEEAVHRLNSSLAGFVKSKKTAVICSYDKRDYSSVSFIQTIEDLERLVVGDKILDNPCHIPPDETVGGDRDIVRIDIMLKNIHDYNEYKAELQNKIRLFEERKGEVDILLPELRRLKDIVNNSPATAFLWDASEGWPVVFVSQNISNFGYNPVDFYSGKIVFSDIIHPDDVERVADEVKRYTEEGRVEYNQEYRILTSPGDVRWVDDRTIVHRDGDGRVLMFEGVIMDITESMELEEELRLSNEKLKNTFDSIQDALYVIDKDYNVVNVNRVLLDTFGFDRKEIIGKACYNIFHGTDRPCEPCPAKKVFEEKKPCRMEMSGEDRFGRRRYYDAVGSPVYDENGEPVIAIISGRDITEMREYRDAVEEANRKLHLLSQITRHDILNSLTVAAGYLDLLEDNPDPGSEEYFSGLSKSIRTIQHQIEFTRDYQNMGVSPPKWHDAYPIIQKCRFEGGVPPKDAVVEVKTKDIEIFADPMFEKAVCNIITNAYLHAEGMTCLKIFNEIEGDDLRLVFEDDGQGIPEDKKESIFRPGYVRQHGYGLFLVKEVLGITDIAISETGEPGKGARFEVLVPSGKWRFVEKI